MCLPVIHDGHTLAVKGDDLAVYDKNPHSARTITVLQKRQPRVILKDNPWLSFLESVKQVCFSLPEKADQLLHIPEGLIAALPRF